MSEMSYGAAIKKVIDKWGINMMLRFDVGGKRAIGHYATKKDEIVFAVVGEGRTWEEAIADAECTMRVSEYKYDIEAPF